MVQRFLKFPTKCGASIRKFDLIEQLQLEHDLYGNTNLTFRLSEKILTQKIIHLQHI